MKNKMDKQPNSSKSFKKWADRIQKGSHIWLQSELIYLRKAIGHCGLQNPGERALLFSLFNQRCQEIVLRILPEHDLLGQNYLLSKSLTQSGKMRKSNRLSDEQIAVMQSLNFHTIDGLKRCGGNQILPVYVAHDKMGNWFSYTGTVYEMMEIVDEGVYCHKPDEVNHV